MVVLEELVVGSIILKLIVKPHILHHKKRLSRTLSGMKYKEVGEEKSGIFLMETFETTFKSYNSAIKRKERNIDS